MTANPNFSLRAFNTFGVEVKAAFFAGPSSVEGFQLLLTDPACQAMPKLVLGGGSNVLFTRDFDGLALHNRVKEIKLLREDREHAWIKAGGGEVWHELVLWCLERGYGGIENLTLIPGSLGAAPVQNIGAYGVELKDVLVELEAVDLDCGRLRRFSREDCRFGYRDSIFKHEAGRGFAIVFVTLELDKKPSFKLSYESLREELRATNIAEPTLRAVSQAVANIRRRKLPDPARIGNAGSFFKNPEIPLGQYSALRRRFPDLVGYPASGERMRLSAARLIELCGWKGKKNGHVGMHQQQALVLVNHGGATGQELLEHAMKVRESVLEKFEVALDLEVHVI